MVGDNPVRMACVQHRAFHLGIRFFTGAQTEFGMNGARPKNGDICPITGQQRQRGAAGKQSLLVVPFPAEQDQLNVFPVAKMLGEGVITVSGP